MDFVRLRFLPLCEFPQRLLAPASHYARSVFLLKWGPASDLDFRVDRGKMVDMLALGGLYSDLKESFQKKLDVLTTQMISPSFLDAIRREEVLIYATINRDRDIVRHILRYCEQIDTAHKDFGHSKERFEANTTYQNAISMGILQIGELIGRLSDDFKKTNLEIPWHKIRGMRNYVAREYGSMDFEVVWYVSTNCIADVLASFVSLQFVFLKLTIITYNIRLKFSWGYTGGKKYRWREWLCGSYWIRTRRPLQCFHGRKICQVEGHAADRGAYAQGSC